jgi:hypothetical protein
LYTSFWHVKARNVNKSGANLPPPQSSDFPNFGIKQIVEKERTVFGTIGGRHGRVKPAPLLGFLAGHNGPTDGLGVGEDAGLDGFMFSGCGHYFQVSRQAVYSDGRNR